MYNDRNAVKRKAVKPSFNEYELAVIEKLCEAKKMQPATLIHALAVESIEKYLGMIDISAPKKISA